ncbi:cytochrome P450 CYP72A219-like isoform X2 [Telopea speciosissima]|uniref:cytochrome P450 CYP72A219-like isoform X2 n=1 Tax=Telopea speciosissima TaxID=54955 RepID=UPI001CC6232D|nr:cytochrome P450 CYP72A219-like isoform X2 [Telopea speciosissima]
MGESGFILMVILCILNVLWWGWKMLDWIWWRPKKLERLLKEQGIKVTPYKLLLGDLKDNMRLFKEARSKPMNLSHDIAPRVLPFDLQTIQKYGKNSAFWFGTTPRLYIMDPHLIKDVMNKHDHFQKIKGNQFLRFFLSGVVLYEGEKWAKHRRILNPAFHMEKLKRMVSAFYTSSNEMVSKWEKLVTSNGSCELDVWPEFQNLTGDVISRAAFGSSYEEGKRIFKLQDEQAEHFIQSFLTAYIPGFSLLPTKRNRRMKEIYREVRTLLMGIINKRQKVMEVAEAANNNDLLGLLLESNNNEIQENKNKKNVGMTIDEVIEECKLFYFAGQETTSVLLVWTMVTLSMHSEWQVRAREEVIQVFGKNKPDFDGLNHLKIVTMIMYEVLRLYPPLLFFDRCTYKNMKLGELSLPAGTQLMIPTVLVHRDRELWGEDAEEFNPGRFAEGISKATKNQVSFFPFSWGPRICIGQQFATIEVKMALAMILQRFSFELSPSYAHAPTTVITLHPQYGAQIILHKL